MRKPRDFDSEMKALGERTKLLKERKLHQLGELVIATGTDVLPIDVLAGAMLAAVEHPEQQYPHLIADIARWLPARPEPTGVGAPHTLDEHLHPFPWSRALSRRPRRRWMRPGRRSGSGTARPRPRERRRRDSRPSPG